MATVSDILETRLQAGEPNHPFVASLSLLAHGLFVVGLVLASRPQTLKVLPTYLPVHVVSPAQLARASAPSITAPAAPPRPEAKELKVKPRQVIEKVKTEVESPTAMPLPERPKEKPRHPQSVPIAAKAPPTPSVELPTAVVRPSNGEAKATANFGASVSSFDSDFPFAYYVEQLQSLIGANWLKPSVPDGTTCVIAFKIQRSGQVTDIRIEASSGLPFYDRAATRSLYAANPLPPLPPEYRREQLGVHLRFQ